MSNDRPEIGAFVTCSAKLYREIGGYYDRVKGGWPKRWKSVSYSHSDWDGYYIGYRTLSNGYVNYSDEGGAYVPDEHFEAWLIVPNERERPFRVLPKDCTEQQS